MTKKEIKLKRTALIISTVFVLSVFVSALVFISRTNFNTHALSERQQTTEDVSLGKYKRLGVAENADATDNITLLDETVSETEKEELSEISTEAESTTKKNIETTTEIKAETTSVATTEKETRSTVIVKINDETMTFIKDIVRFTNDERKKEGLPELTFSMEMELVAMQRAEEASESFSHTRPNGLKASSILNQLNIKGKIFGENLAMGQTSAEEVVADWMASESHRTNILAKEYTKVSIGIYEKDGVLYFSQLFIG